MYHEIVHFSAYSYLVFEHGSCTFASPSYRPIVGYGKDEELDTAGDELLIRGHARLLGEVLHRTKNDLSMIRSILHLQAENTFTRGTHDYRRHKYFTTRTHAAGS